MPMYSTLVNSMDALVLLRREDTKYPQKEIETKCGAETEGKTIHRLPHLVFHPLFIYKTQTLLSMPTNTC